MKVLSLNRVQLFATPWTVAYQAPPSMGFSRQEYWSGLPLPSLILDTKDLQIGYEEKMDQSITRLVTFCYVPRIKQPDHLRVVRRRVKGLRFIDFLFWGFL